MYEFILQLAVFLSLGVIVFLMARAVPRIEEGVGTNAASSQPNYFDRLLERIPLNKFDSSINSFLSKILRRLKVFVLKIDNLITNHLNKLLKKNHNGGKNQDNMIP